MTTALLIAAVIAAIVVLAAQWLNRRHPVDPPSQTFSGVPAQLDRADFVYPDAPWLVVVFTSETCDACAGMASKAAVLASDHVGVDVVPFGARRSLHERYRIDAVPLTLVADRAGVVQASFAGPITATDLWAAVAEIREPGSTPPPEAHTRGDCKTDTATTGNHTHPH